MGELLRANNGKGEVFITWKGIDTKDGLLDLLHLVQGFIEQEKQRKAIYQTEKGEEIVVESIKV